jgi:lipopolysaccharide transport system permease protein
VGACLIDFAISFSILLGLMVYYGIVPTPQALMVLPLTFLTIFTALGMGTLLSALNVAYRDFRYVIPFLVQIWMFATPVIYPVRIVPQKWQWLLSLNPMSGIVDAYRSAILGKAFQWGNLAISLSVACGVFLCGLAYFRRFEREFADIV